MVRSKASSLFRGLHNSPNWGIPEWVALWGMTRTENRGPRPVHSPHYRHMLGRLRAARLGAGLTQVQVAAALGKTQAFVSKCELGERRIDPIELNEFARLYGKTLSHFVTRRP